MLPEQMDGGATPANSKLVFTLVSEFLGTFKLMLTDGLNVLAESKATWISIAASLMVMIKLAGCADETSAAAGAAKALPMAAVAATTIAAAVSTVGRAVGDTPAAKLGRGFLAS